MTYNFDPDKWYDMELAILRKKMADGELTQRDFDSALQLLDDRLDAMWKRLDGTYQVIPKPDV